MNQQQFTKEEWEACIKVLNFAKENPHDVPDELLFKGLITKIHKQAKKNIAKVNAQQKRANDFAKVQQTGIFKTHQAQKNQEKISINKEEKLTQLEGSHTCYVCSTSYNQLHSFYHLLCPICAKQNYQKRFQKADFTNYTVLITGGRIKIGLATALHFLRSGAKVIVTSRFPKAALLTYEKENDFDQWKERLEVYGLDFRDILSVEKFTYFIQKKYTSLEIIINNAAQTIKRETDYYVPLLKKEQEQLPEYLQKLLGKFQESQVPLIEARNQKFLGNPMLYPPQRFNYDGQATDLRDKNSWVLPLEEVSTEELVEVHLINSVAPFILNGQLKKMLKKSPFFKRFIINVTSKEGIFTENLKKEFHPHTNMSKAAMNMMTLTSAEDYTKENIYMNSVDPGWASHENPIQIQQKMNAKGFVPPLDFIDSASRILDPIIQGLESEEPIYGKLLKNYQEITW